MRALLGLGLGDLSTHVRQLLGWVDRMGSGEEERGGAVSEAFTTDSADGSSSSSDAASTDHWPVVLAKMGPKMAPKTACCAVMSDTEMGKQHKQKRRATSTGNIIGTAPPEFVGVSSSSFLSVVNCAQCTELLMVNLREVSCRHGNDEGKVREAAARGGHVGERQGRGHGARHLQRRYQSLRSEINSVSASIFFLPVLFLDETVLS